MSLVHLMEQGTASSWPTCAQRRSGVAAALLLLLLLDARLDAFLVAWGPAGWDEAWGWLYVAFTIVEIGVPLLLLPLLGPGALCAALGARPSPMAMVSGFLCGLAGVAVFVSAMYLRYLFPPLHAEVPPAVGSMFVAQLSLTLLGPMAEEWAVRGVLWCALRRVCGPWVAIAITSVMFALLHGPDRLLDFPYLFPFGVMICILRARSGSLSPSILAHSVTNTGLFVFTSM